jgi:glyoxylase-like metal-dependent hydrolase (beta-lactamase superfamily II)
MSNFYSFRVGEFQCAAVSDGWNDYEPAGFFTGAAHDEMLVELERAGMTSEVLTTPYTFLTVNTGEHQVLVDTGAGSLAATTGQLPASLRDAGVREDDIDVVIITHAHPDHIGGLLDGDGRPRYPNARYFIARLEWEFWFSDDAYAKAPRWFVELARTMVRPFEREISLIEHGSNIVPGVTLLDARGHTPGHSMVAFTSGSSTLVFGSDAVVLPIHLEHPDWTAARYDVDPVAADETKRRVADLMAAEGWLVLFQHFPPFPSLGRIVKSEGAWRWMPVETGLESTGSEDR